MIHLTVSPLSFEFPFSTLELFACFESQPWAILLDSGDSDHVDSQYDIIAWEPTHCITADKEFTKVYQPKTQQEVIYSASPFSVLENALKESFQNLKLPTSHLPFVGGALGYFSYDLGRTIEKIPTIAKHDIQTPDMAIGLYNQAIIFDKSNKVFQLICPVNMRDEIEKKILSRLLKMKNKPCKEASFSLTSTWQANMSYAEYQTKFSQVQEYLLNGDTYQINLAQRFSADYQGNEFIAYKRLRNANQSPFSGFMRLPSSSILSVSPERFLKLSQGKVQTKPIKGTSVRSSDLKQDKMNALSLINSEKDRAENLMIVDLLRNDISKTCKPGSVIVPSLFKVESFAAVHHLVSTVEGTLNETENACDLLKGAFPGGSITGAPKIRAMEIIEELEPHRRSVYCGSMGYISYCGNMDTSITIRTLICENQKIHCWAGGGLVADSKVESEYQETLDKLGKILPIL